MTDETNSSGKPTYTKPTMQVDLERRLANDNKSALALQRGRNPGDPEPDAAPYATDEHNVEGYIGTDPVYRNYADPTHEPIATAVEDGPEGAVVARIEDSLARGKTAQVPVEAVETQGDNSTDPPSGATGTGSQGDPTVPAPGSETESQEKPANKDSSESQQQAPAQAPAPTPTPAAATSSVVGVPDGDSSTQR